MDMNEIVWKGEEDKKISSEFNVHHLNIKLEVLSIELKNSSAKWVRRVRVYINQAEAFSQFYREIDLETAKKACLLWLDETGKSLSTLDFSSIFPDEED